MTTTVAAEPIRVRYETPRRRVAVIGSGFGGLAAAIRLQSAGIDTVLFEQRDKAGGRAYVYHDRGFTFDAGPTVITAPPCLEELFELSGRRMADYVEMLPVSPFYRLQWEDGDRFDYVGDRQQLLAQVRTRSEADAAGYLRFVEYTKQVFAKGYTELAAAPFLRFWDMVRVAPHLGWLRADRSVYQTVAQFIKDEHLRQAFSFHSLLVGGSPFDTSAIYTLIHYLELNWGVYFPRGGTGALVQALVRLFEDLGGELRLNCPVDRIRESAGRHFVTTHQHVDERFDAVVSNADLHHTYGTLYQGDPRAARQTRRLEGMDWSMSLFVAYFGTDITYPDVAHHTILFGPRYKGLIQEIFNGPKLPDDFSLYLHAPTRSDSTLAPPGCEAFYVLSPVPHLGKAAIDWADVGPRYAEQIYQYLEEKCLPGLRQHMITQRIFTPADFQSVFHTYKGSAFSVAPKLTQSAYFRPHNRDAAIPHLYIVGAGTHPGAGVPGVVNSAKATVGLVLEDLSVPTFS